MRIRIIVSLSILNLNSVKHQLAVGEIPRTARTPSRARPKATEPRPSNLRVSVLWLACNAPRIPLYSFRISRKVQTRLKLASPSLHASRVVCRLKSEHRQNQPRLFFSTASHSNNNNLDCVNATTIITKQNIYGFQLSINRHWNCCQPSLIQRTSINSSAH